MTLFGPGQFSVNGAERVTVNVTKSTGTYSAVLTELFGGCIWALKPTNAGTLGAQGGFDVPAAGGVTISFGGLFNFMPSGDVENGSPDFYMITISGSNGGSFPIPVFGPGAPTRTFTFFS